MKAERDRLFIQKAKTVVAELNPNMPRTCGDTFLSMDKIDKAVIVDDPITEYLYPPIDNAVAERIARNAARIIDNGSTLQVGLGRNPNEMLQYIEGRRDIGIHTDVICDSIIDLIERSPATRNRSIEGKL